MKRAIHTKTQEEFNRVLEIFDKKGWEWSEGDDMLYNMKLWEEWEDQMCIDYHNYCEYASKEYYQGWVLSYEIISFEQFLEMEEESTPVKDNSPLAIFNHLLSQQDTLNIQFREAVNKYITGNGTK